jgi:sortase (surface protein transpeptidase)
VLNPTPEPHLTLVTCFPFYYVGPAPMRFVVHAREIGLVLSRVRYGKGPRGYAPRGLG